MEGVVAGTAEQGISAAVAVDYVGIIDAVVRIICHFVAPSSPAAVSSDAVDRSLRQLMEGEISLADSWQHYY